MTNAVVPYFRYVHSSNMLGYINVRHDVCTNDEFKQVFIISIPNTKVCPL